MYDNPAMYAEEADNQENNSLAPTEIQDVQPTEQTVNNSPKKKVNRRRIVFVIAGIIFTLWIATLLRDQRWSSKFIPSLTSSEGTEQSQPKEETINQSISESCQQEASGSGDNATRDYFLCMALATAQKQDQALVQTRTNYFLDLAKQKAAKDNTPIELSLLRRLRQQTEQMTQIVGRKGEWIGTAPQIAEARALVGDSYAILIALQTIYKDESGITRRDTVRPAEMTRFMQQFNDQAWLSFQATPTSELRTEEKLRQMQQQIDRLIKQQEASSGGQPNDHKNTSPKTP